jgi:hypothetical protein
MAFNLTGTLFKGWNDDGTPAAGAYLYTFASGTTTPQATYTDSTLGTPNANPVILNSRGEAQVWLGLLPYSMKLTTPTGVQIGSTVDGIADSAGALLADLASTAPGKGALKIGRGVAVVNSMTELRALTKTSASTNAYLTGYYSATSGGGGMFSYVASDTTTADNGGTIIVASDGGRWYRDFTGPVHAEWFGFVADAAPTTYVSAGGYGVSNVTALNAALNAAWLNKNYAPNVAGGGYGACVVLPPGYAQLAGALPVIVAAGTALIGCEQYVSVLCCIASYRPRVQMVDGNYLERGAVYCGSPNTPQSNVNGYPQVLRGVSVLSLNSSGPGIVVDSNTVTLKDCWVAGFLGSGISLANTNTTVENCASELNGTGLTFENFSNGNTVTDLVCNNQSIGVTVANRKWFSVAATGNSGGASAVAVIAANQNINTGYTWLGVTTTAANFTGYRVTVKSGTGVGQTGIVTACAMNGSYQFVLTITATGSAWVALDATSKVVIFNSNLENKLTNYTPETHTYGHINVIEAYGFICSATGASQTATLPANGAAYVANSENVTFNGFTAGAALDYRLASTSLNGIIIGPGNKNIQFNGGSAYGWANGIFQGSGCLTDGLTINGFNASDNSNTGITVLDGLKTTIANCTCINNGKTGTPGTGISVTNAQSQGLVNIVGNTCSPYVNGTTPNQGTGISVTASTTTSWINISGNLSKAHATADYTLAGSTEAIYTDPSVPKPAVTVASAATIAVPASYQQGGNVSLSGSTTITSITAAPAGSSVTLIAQATPTITKGGNLKLTSTFVMTAGSALTLKCDGTNWYEVGRAAV